MIGLDAAAPELIERWTADGSLPHLARFFERAAYGRLEPPDGILLGPPWPSFHTGRRVSDHGLYEYLVWDPARMQEVRASTLRELTPFWRRSLGAFRSVVVDVPLVPSPEPFDGVEVTCWATHERLVPFGSYPPGLADRIARAETREPMPPEAHHRVAPAKLLRERDALCRATRSVARLSSRLLGEEQWDLGVACFSTTHRAGHKLWDSSGSNGAGSRRDVEQLETALLDVYRAVDEGVGTLIEAATPHDHVMVFALHGMGPNTSRALVLPELLDRILHPDRGGGRSVLGAVRDSVPLGLRGWVKRRLPGSLQDRLGTFWRQPADWRHTRAISLAADVHGFIRINLAGREAEGVVDPADFEALCDEISEGLLGFRDERSGQPLVERVVRREEAYPGGTSAELLPDLIVVWSDRPNAEISALASERHGRIAWPAVRANPDGRSGNHRPEGWLAAAGPRVKSAPDATILDLAPTALSLLGADVPDDFAGRPLYTA